MTTKDPITCHVLDTVDGRPAANISVKLSCSSQTDVAFTSTTNSDGRISNWGTSKSNQTTIESIVESQFGSTIWKLEFNTGAYYGEGKTFWPVVELTFYVQRGEHYHVPLLLGPYSYTTYRGS
jgi:5-hydroxyisourate hydrolase